VSSGGFCPVGRPDAMLEDATFLFFVYCGSVGGGGCVLPMGVTGVTYPVKIPKFITRNTKLIFENPEFTGIRIYTDGGPAGTCPNSVGTEVPFYMALSVDGLLTAEQIMAQGVQLMGATPYSIEFNELKIPQPTHPDWDGNIYVQLYWGNTAYINGIGPQVPNDSTLKITKHDYEIVQ